MAQAAILSTHCIETARIPAAKPEACRHARNRVSLDPKSGCIKTVQNVKGCHLKKNRPVYRDIENIAYLSIIIGESP
jgi:hypothetical protein